MTASFYPGTIRKCLGLIVLFIALFLSTNAQTIQPATAEAAGFSSARLKRLDAALNDWSAREWMNGGVALVIRNGKIAYHKAVGFNDMASKTPLQKDGIFRIASQTKAVTSVAIMMLFEDGKLLLTDPVSKYLPSFKKQVVLQNYNAADTTYTTVPAQREITIKDLLTHTSGIGYAQIGSKEARAIYAKNNLTTGLGVMNESLLDAMTRLGKLPLMHQPGEKFTYGLNTDVLGCLVEVISGLSLDAFFKTRIFEPLGMKDTYFTVPKEKAARLVNLYYEDSTGHLQKSDNKQASTPSAATFPLFKSTYYSGGAGLSSTITDYGVFLQMLLNGGTYNGRQLLGRNTVRMMTMNQIGDLSLDDDKFGLGFAVVTQKGSAHTPAQEGTFSWGGAFSTSYWVDPKEKLVLLLFRQMLGSSHDDVVEKFRVLTYSALVD